MGRDRRQRYRVAGGSEREVRSALRVAEAWGYLELEEIEIPLQTLDRLLRMIWGLSN